MPVCAITIAADRKLVVEMVLALWKNARVLPGIHPYLQRYVKTYALPQRQPCLQHTGSIREPEDSKSIFKHQHKDM